MSCYIHAVSPVKKADRNERRYFNLILQTKDESIRAVCFATEKQSELKTLENVKSPVKIQNFQKPAKDVLLNRFTKIKPIEKSEIDFNWADICNSEGFVPNISSIQNVAGEQVISLKGEIAQLSGVKYVNTLHHGKLKKQEVIVRDTTSSTKLILWEQHVDSLELNKTYLLKNLRLKATKTDRYLNTAKTEKFTFSETQPSEYPLVEVDQSLSVVTSTTWTAKILGIQQITKQASCVSCGKSVNQLSNGILGECSSKSCGMNQVLSSCPAQWYLKVPVQNINLNPIKSSVYHCITMMSNSLWKYWKFILI